MEIINKTLWVLGLVALCAIAIITTIATIQERHLNRHRERFRPSVIKNGEMYFVRYVPQVVGEYKMDGFPLFGDYPDECQVFEDYDLAITMLELVRKTNPKSELMEI